MEKLYLVPVYDDATGAKYARFSSIYKAIAFHDRLDLRRPVIRSSGAEKAFTRKALTSQDFDKNTAKTWTLVI